MKITECSIIENKILDDMIDEFKKSLKYTDEDSEVTKLYGKIEALTELKQHLKPLEPIVRDAYCMGRIDIRGLFTNKYINETEI